MLRRGAAALAFAAVAAAACSSGTTSGEASPTPSPTTSPSTVATPSPSAAPTADATPDALPAFGRPGEPVVLGDGRVVAAGSDGRSLLVAADDPDDGERLACEGAPFEYLWRMHADAPGERSLAITDVAPQDQPYLGNVVPNPAGDRVLLVGSCEGFLGDIHVADLAADASVSNLRLVDYPSGEWASWTIRWTPDGDAFTMAASTAFDASGAVMVFPDTGEWLDVSSDALTGFFFAPGDRAVEITEEGGVTWLDPDGTLLADVPGDEAVASPDGDLLLVTEYGEPGSVVLVDLLGEVRPVADVAGFAPTFSPDGSVIAWLYSVADRSSLALRHVATGRQHDISDVGFGAPQFLDGGIAYTALRDDPDFLYVPEVRYRPWER